MEWLEEPGMNLPMNVCIDLLFGGGMCEVYIVPIYVVLDLSPYRASFMGCLVLGWLNSTS